MAPDAVDADGPDLDNRLPRAVSDRIRNAFLLAARREREPSSACDDLDSAAAAQDDVAFLASALPEYEIRCRLNYGGQGVIYLCVHRSSRRPVAVKLLLDGPLSTPRQRQRFEREIDVISRLEHPNIVRLYQSGMVRGRPYYAMQYVEGLSIDEYVLVNDLSPEAIARLFLTVCRAVSYAHQQGVIHRDLNPANVLVDVDGTPFVCDFGLARDAWIGAKDAVPGTITRTGQIVGTFPYLAPEQMGGDGGQTDTRTDIYALAVMLHCLLTGDYPYEISPDREVFRNTVLTRPPRSVLRNGPDRNPPRTSRRLLGDLDAILLKALAKEKALRYQSVSSFADDIERAMRAEPIEARPAGRFYLLQHAVRRHRMAVGVAASFFVVLVGSLALVTTSWMAARRDRDRAEMFASRAYAALENALAEVDRIKPLAGGAAARQAILANVEQDFNSLVETAAFAQFAGLKAPLSERQGEIAEAMGNKAEARRRYEQFLAAATETGSRVQALQSLARVVEDGESYFEKAIAEASAWLARDPESFAAVFALCSARAEFARRLAVTDRFPQAAQQVDFALALLRGRHSESSPRWKILLADLYECDGDVRPKLGQGLQAIESLRQALQFHRELSACTPADADRKHRLLVGLAKLADALRYNGDTEEAKGLLHEAIAIGEFLVQTDPTMVFWKRDLSGAYQRSARIHAADAEIQPAIAHASRGVQIARDLAENHPDNQEWQDLLGFALISRGRVRLAAKEHDGARDDLEWAVAIRRRLAECEPGDLSRKRRLAEAYMLLGDWSLAAHGPQRAMELMREASRLFDSARDGSGETTQNCLELALARFKLGTIHGMIGSPEHIHQAERLLAEASAVLDELWVNGELMGQHEIYNTWRAAIDRNRLKLALAGSVTTQN